MLLLFISVAVYLYLIVSLMCSLQSSPGNDKTFGCFSLLCLPGPRCSPRFLSEKYSNEKLLYIMHKTAKSNFLLFKFYCPFKTISGNLSNGSMMDEW